ncbi:energy transducer TonB [Mucilaginibacter sp. NFX135]|uniref:energy transducer TonB n=1 Tax=Mucilaginibacter sp. NFX135 TaxID=3402687 RepID=UPI003AFAFE7A
MKVPKPITIVLLISSLLTTLTSVAQMSSKKENSPPQFPGGQDSLASFLARNLRYPEREIDVRGKVIIQFTVTKTGEIKQSRIIRKLYESVDAEALRVIKLMPKWIPAYIKGKPVEMIYTMPINFTWEAE